MARRAGGRGPRARHVRPLGPVDGGRRADRRPGRAGAGAGLAAAPRGTAGRVPRHRRRTRARVRLPAVDGRDAVRAQAGPVDRRGAGGRARAGPAAPAALAPPRRAHAAGAGDRRGAAAARRPARRRAAGPGRRRPGHDGRPAHGGGPCAGRPGRRARLRVGGSGRRAPGHRVPRGDDPPVAPRGRVPPPRPRGTTCWCPEGPASGQRAPSAGSAGGCGAAGGVDGAAGGCSPYPAYGCA